jgi:hypothetical protein
MLKDAEFHADAKRSGILVDPRTADQITTMLTRIGKTSPVDHRSSPHIAAAGAPHALRKSSNTLLRTPMAQ